MEDTQFLPQSSVLKNQAVEIASSTRGQTAEARRTTILQPVEQKPHSQKDKMKRQRAKYQMKEKTNPRKTTK